MAYNIGRHVSLNDSFSKITEKSIDLFPPTDSAKSAFDLFPTTDNVKDINPRGSTHVECVALMSRSEKQM